MRTYAVYFKNAPNGEKFLKEIIVTDADNAKDVLERWIRKSEERREKIVLLSEPIYSAPMPELALHVEVSVKISYPNGPAEVAEIIGIEYVNHATV